MTNFTGTTGKDNITGTASGDRFDMSQGGKDKVFGLDGLDVFEFGAELTEKDKIDGGTGNDIVVLSGDYSAGLALSADSFTSVETIAFDNGHSYDIRFDAANFTNGFSIDGRELVAGESLFANASKSTTGTLNVYDGAGDDVLKTGGSNDTFVIRGGTDAVYGGAGVDSLSFGATLDSLDLADGGDGTNDFLSLTGDYSAGLSITKSMVKNVENVTLSGAFDYDLTIGNKVGALAFLCSNISAGHSATIDASGEKTVAVRFVGSAGDDTFRLGKIAGTMDLSQGGDDKATGNDGADLFSFDDEFTAGDRVKGGGDPDTVRLTGDYSAGLTIDGNMIESVEHLDLGAGWSYTITLDDSAIAVGTVFVVDASSLSLGVPIVIDASAELDAAVTFSTGSSDDTLDGGAVGDFLYGGGGNDVLRGHNGADTFLGSAGDDTVAGGLDGDTLSGGAGADRINGGFGIDTYQLTGVVSDSTSVTHDTFVGFNFNQDRIDLVAGVSGIGTRITGGTLNAGNFDTELAAVVNAAALAANAAVLFTADAGDLSGHTYLIIDRAGGAGYQANSDFVIEIESGTNLNGLDTGDFI